VAVLEIHMDMINAVSITPMSIFPAECPVDDSMNKAKRRCNPHFSMAKLRRKPPRKRNSIGSMYWADTTLISAMPQAGINIKGRKEVTAICTASVSHQSAIHIVSPIINGISG
jgi:hypothetical protein